MTTTSHARADAPGPASRRLRGILSLDDFELAAQRHLPRPVFQDVAGGVEDNVSREANRAVFREWGLVPRALAGVSGRSQATTLLGREYAHPFGVAPIGIAALYAYRGDLVLAQAAAAANIPMAMSGSSLIRLEEVVQAAPDARRSSRISSSASLAPDSERWC